MYNSRLSVKNFLLGMTLVGVSLNTFATNATEYLNVAGLDVELNNPVSKAESEINKVNAAAEDSLITAKVKVALLSDKVINGGRLNVETERGVVVLTGDLDNKTQQLRAVQIASSVHDVKSVINRMKVLAGEKQPTGKLAFRSESDSIISTAVKAALLNDEEIPGLQIDVDAAHGIVVLHGQIDSKDHAQKAYELAASVEGVKAVKNRLIVSKK